MKDLSRLPAKGIELLDPSDIHRDVKLLRVYEQGGQNAILDRVRKTYDLMHTNQTVEYANTKMDRWCTFTCAEMTIMEALQSLNSFIDASDPDVDLPNSVHAFQTAERIREKYPEHDWFQLTGLIHDIGKIMALHGEPQWSTVGDTFPVGCAFSDKIVYGRESFSKNPDASNPAYSTQLGVYSEGCGLDNVRMSWGHDEYLYRVLKNHASCSLPEEAYYMIRFHSFYPWHTGGDYMYLCNDKDKSMLQWVKAFNQFDLYSKVDDVPDVEALVPYYQSLVDKYIPGKVKW